MNVKEHILSDIQRAFPDVGLRTEEELRAWLDEAVPTMVRHWLLSSRTLKVCSGISPDFAEIGAAHGFPVVTVRVPGHFYNAALTTEGALLIDLSAAQFEVCRAGLRDFDPDEIDSPEYKHLEEVFERIERDPFSAVRIERIDPRDIGSYAPPTGRFLADFVDPTKKYERARRPRPVLRNPRKRAIPPEIEALLPDLVRVAQEQYDSWQQDEEGYDEGVGSGGICHLIADDLLRVLDAQGIVCTTVSSHHEVHVYVVLKIGHSPDQDDEPRGEHDGVWEIDLRPHIYERGGGYTWTKIPDVTFDETDFTIDRLSPFPEDFREYTDSE